MPFKLVAEKAWKRSERGVDVIVVKGRWCQSEKNVLGDIRNNRDLFLISATELRVHHPRWQDFWALDIFLVQQENIFYVSMATFPGQAGGNVLWMGNIYKKKKKEEVSDPQCLSVLPYLIKQPSAVRAVRSNPSGSQVLHLSFPLSGFGS